MTQVELGYREASAMEIKKGAKSPSKKEKLLDAKKVADFVENAKGELFRITWPSKDELKLYTQLVVAATFLFGIGLYFVDLVIHQCLMGLGALAHLFG